VCIDNNVLSVIDNLCKKRPTSDAYSHAFFFLFELIMLKHGLNHWLDNTMYCLASGSLFKALMLLYYT